MAHGMPRLDTLRELDAAGELRAAASGASRGSRRAPGRRRARSACARGSPAAARRRARSVGSRSPEPAGAGRRQPRPSVAICMATYEPPPELLAGQLDSIRAQTARGLDLRRSPTTARRPSGSPTLERLVAGDPRFVRLALAAPARLLPQLRARAGARARRRALRRARRPGRRLAPGQARDAARRDRRRASSSTATRASSARTARLVARTYWERRAQQPRRPDLAARRERRSPARRRCSRARCSTTRCRSRPRSSRTSTTTGSGSARSPRARSATSTGRSTTTCSTAARTLGHAAANRMPRLRDRLGALRRDPRERVRLWRMHYFVDACRLLQFATILRAALRRPDGARQAPRARALRARRPVGRARSRGSARAARASSSRGGRETLGAEWMLLHAFALAPAARRRPRATARSGTLRLDAVPPPALDPRPGRDGAGASRTCARSPRRSRRCGSRSRDDAPAAGQRADPDDRPAPLLRRLHRQAQPRAAARRARPARAGRHRRPGRLAARRLARADRGLQRAGRRLRPRRGRRSGASRHGLEVSRADALRRDDVVDGAHRRTRRCASSAATRFLYLIQEYEPFTFPMGSYAALADASYRLPHTALFSTELLRDYFRPTRPRRVREPAPATPPRSRTRSPPIDPPGAGGAGRAGDAPAAVLRAAGAARGAQHVRARRARARARRRATACSTAGRCTGIGTVQGRRRLDLGGGASLELLPRAAQGDYARCCASTTSASR